MLSPELKAGWDKYHEDIAEFKRYMSKVYVDLTRARTLLKKCIVCKHGLKERKYEVRQGFRYYLTCSKKCANTQVLRLL